MMSRRSSGTAQQFTRDHAAALIHEPEVTIGISVASPKVRRYVLSEVLKKGAGLRVVNPWRRTRAQALRAAQ